MKITAALQHVGDALQGAGLDAGHDTDHLNPPCAWVAVDSIDPGTLDGAGQLNLSVYLIVAATGYATEVEALQSLLQQALTVIAPDGEIKLNEGVQTSAGILPAFKIPLTVKVEA